MKRALLAGLLVAFSTIAAPASEKPVAVRVNAPAPSRLTDRMQVLLETFEDRLVLGDQPSSVTVRWRDIGYSLDFLTWWDYRQGKLTYMRMVARMKILPPASGLFSRLEEWVPGGLATLMLALALVLAAVLVWMLVSRQRTRVAGGPRAPSPHPAPNPVLSLWTASGVFPLSLPCTAIGAGEQNDIRIRGPGVAAFHARVWLSPEGAFYIEDLGSETGVCLNGQRVQQGWLTPGTVVSLGSWQGKVDWSYPPSA